MPTPRTTIAIVLAMAAVFVTACAADDTAVTPISTDRQDAVAERGADVMPFDLDATTHTFSPTDDGLVEDVTADDVDDGESIALIREHLADERERFGRGDFGDPAQIHGDEMPGLAELQAGAAEIEIVYEDLDDGARLTFTTDDPPLVDALHRWGEAQVTDHGEHANGLSGEVHPLAATRFVFRLLRRPRSETNGTLTWAGSPRGSSPGAG